MPSYQFRCRTCGDGFVVQRAMAESTTAAARCPEGHEDTTRVFTAVAVGGRAGNGGTSPSAAPMPAPTAGGGCCGGGCCG
ncbi:MAG TPA: FmdB family zinc ribbon protein [Frankiaceae bacterium]|nr:FmdB family zinc ribbon protein [Frankiaceae bacterium]